MIWWALVALAVVVFIVAAVLLWVADSNREKANETYNSMSKTVRNIVEHDRFEARGDSDTLRRNLRQDIRQAVKEAMEKPKVVTDDDFLKIPLASIFDATANHGLFDSTEDMDVHFFCTREDQADLFNRLKARSEARKIQCDKANEVSKKAKKGKRA
jgi:hypothetical protein